MDLGEDPPGLQGGEAALAGSAQAVDHLVVGVLNLGEVAALHGLVTVPPAPCYPFVCQQLYADAVGRGDDPVDAGTGQVVGRAG